MATTTRYHLPSAGTPPISPAFDTYWNDTSQAIRLPMPVTRLESVLTPMVDLTVTVPQTSQSILVCQYVSEPIPSQMFSSSELVWYSVNRCSVSNANLHCTYVSVLRILPSGPVPLGFVAQSNPSGTEVSVVSTSNYITYTSNLAFTSRAGDRLIYELGFLMTSPSVSGTASLRVGNQTGVADFGLNTTTTTDLNPKLDSVTAFYFFKPVNNNNYITSVTAGDGMSVGERVR